MFRSVVAVVFKNEMLFYLPSSSLPGLSGINVGADSKGLLKPVEPQIQFVTKINGPLSRERDRQTDELTPFFFFLVLFFPMQAIKMVKKKKDLCHIMNLKVKVFSHGIQHISHE